MKVVRMGQCITGKISWEQAPQTSPMAEERWKGQKSVWLQDKIADRIQVWKMQSNVFFYHGEEEIFIIHIQQGADLTIIMQKIGLWR